MTIYVATSRLLKPGIYKIGYTANPAKRLGTLKISCPGLYYDLLVDGSKEDEEGLHEHFKDNRIEHSEWFRLLRREVQGIPLLLERPRIYRAVELANTTPVSASPVRASPGGILRNGYRLCPYCNGYLDQYGDCKRKQDPRCA